MRISRTRRSDDAIAVDRFSPNGVTGYRARTMPNAPVRESREEAAEDENIFMEAEFLKK